MAGGGGLACVDLHVLSLLPRTLGSRYDAILAPGKMSEEKELDALRCFFKSMISCDRVELTAEAKDKATDPLDKCLKNGNQTKVLSQTDQMQGRRQALGRKRARFSFKPNVGQERDPLLRVDTKSSVDHIKDPEEFFSAVEKMEYADKVLKKLRGEVENESIENLKWTPSRKRRPGILGRRASYKHHFSSQLESIEADSLSQCENQALSPLKSTKDPTFIPISLPTIQSGVSRAGEADDVHIYNASDLQGSTAEEEKSVDHILSNLLYSFEDINEGDEIEFLEERLRIKSINVDKVCLPPLDRCHGNNLTITDVKTTRDSSEIDSSNATRSPLASIAALKRRILRKDPLEDPFHMEALSDSSSENSSLNEGSHCSLKTRSRLNSRRNSLVSTVGIQDGMRTPTSNPLANDIGLTTTKDNTRDKVNAIFFEEVDRPDQELHLETSVGVVGTDNSTNGLFFETGALANNEVNDILFEGLVAKEVDLPNQELHLETSAGVVGTDNRTNELFFEAGVLINKEVNDTLVEASVTNKVDDADERSHLEERMVCDKISFDNGTDGHSVETAAVANKKVLDVLEAPVSAGANDTLSSDLDNSSESISRSLRKRKLRSSTATQDDITAGVVCNPLETSSREKVADETVQENHASNNKGSEAESNSRSIIHKEKPESTIQPSPATPRIISNRKIDGIELGSSSVAVPTAIDFSSEDENNIGNEETLITSEAGASADEIPVNCSVNADSLEIGDATIDKASDEQGAHVSNKDQSSDDVATNIPTNGCSESSSVLDEHNSEVQDENQLNSMAALETEAPQKRQSKQKKMDRRQSLAGAGTAWQCGVRRSTRIRTKPLAHWRGERILYARIHDTLPTMIGMKYASPAKSNQKALPALKVKSFVSEEYADLLQKVALH